MTATSEVERFWSRVNKDGPIVRDGLSPCWVWTGAKHKFGYGVCRFMGKTMTAHRVAFFLSHGRWPTPEARHQCDNPSCIRHIEEGTRHQNIADAVERRRVPSGTGHHWWKGVCLKGHPLSRGSRCKVCGNERAKRYGDARRLRETGSAATRQHGTETHCPRGHAYDEANTYRAPVTGHRQCRACKRLLWQERRG